MWFIAIGAGLYVLLRPGVANAPGPNDRLISGPSTGQILLEALSLFAFPGGALSLGGKLGLGFFGRSALAGAASAVGMQAAGDVGQGKLSSPLMYLTDATTGALIGFVVPGGFRLVGKAGTLAFDRLATYGLTQSDIALTSALAEQAAIQPLDASGAQAILRTRGMAGQVSQWWFNRRGVILLYRGQAVETSQILSPLAREQSVAASEALVARMRSFGVTDAEMAAYTAKFHVEPVGGYATLPGLGGERLGMAGIPTTRIPGIAANFGDQGVIYVVRVPVGTAIPAIGWQGLAMEDEYVILNQIPKGSVVQIIPVSRVAPLLIDDVGKLIPGK